MTPPFSLFGFGAGQGKGAQAGQAGGDDPAGKGRKRSHRRRTVLRNPPSGELQTQGGCWTVTLWDISRGGLCLVVRAQEVAIPAGEGLSVRLYDPAGHDSLRLRASLAWVKQESGDTYIGLQLRPGTSLPKGCFLERYLAEER